MKIERFEDIESWKMSRELVKALYQVAGSGRFARDFGLRDQILRAVGSIMHNIAEGFDSSTNPEFVRFLQFSKRSCSEVQSELYVALDQEYIGEEEFSDLYAQCGAIRGKVGGFINYLAQTRKP